MSDRPPLMVAQQVVEAALCAGMDSGNMDPSRMKERLMEIADRITTDTPPKLRMSYGNGCAREKWFAHNMPDSATPRDRSRLVHAMGDLWEIVATETLRNSLPAPWSLIPYYDQAELVNFDGITGHTDGALAYKGKPYAIIDPKFKNFMRSVMHWTPKPDKGVKQQLGDRRFPKLTWGERNQAANYVWTEREKGHDFLGFMWICGFRDESAKFHAAWMTADELRPWYDESRQTFLDAKKEHPVAPIHLDRDATPCRVIFSKKKGTQSIYCNHYHDCISHEDQWKISV